IGLSTAGFWVIVRSSPIGAKHICIIGGHKISPQLRQQHPPASPTTSRSPSDSGRRTVLQTPLVCELGLWTQEGRYARDISAGVAADLGGAGRLDTAPLLRRPEIDYSAGRR